MQVTVLVHENMEDVWSKSSIDFKEDTWNWNENSCLLSVIISWESLVCSPSVLHKLYQEYPFGTWIGDNNFMCSPFLQKGSFISFRLFTFDDPWCELKTTISIYYNLYTSILLNLYITVWTAHPLDSITPRPHYLYQHNTLSVLNLYKIAIFYIKSKHFLPRTCRNFKNHYIMLFRAN